MTLYRLVNRNNRLKVLSVLIHEIREKDDSSRWTKISIRAYSRMKQAQLCNTNTTDYHSRVQCHDELHLFLPNNAHEGRSYHLFLGRTALISFITFHTQFRIQSKEQSSTNWQVGWTYPTEIIRIK
jgi:hypothetical protein